MWYILTSIFILLYQLSIASLLRDNRVESPVISLSPDITSSSPAGSTDRVTVSRLDFLSAASTSTHDRLRAMTMDNVHGWASLWVDLWTCPTYAPHDSPPTVRGTHLILAALMHTRMGLASRYRSGLSTRTNATVTIRYPTPLCTLLTSKRRRGGDERITARKPVIDMGCDAWVCMYACACVCCIDGTQPSPAG